MKKTLRGSEFTKMMERLTKEVRQNNILIAKADKYWVNIKYEY